MNLFLGTVLCLLSISATMAGEVSRIVSGNELFGKNLYNIISKKEGNLVASPFSAHVVLSMAYAGADADTAEAFKTVLAVPGAEETANEYAKLMTNVKAVTNVTLNLANKIFIMESFKLNPTFSSIMTDKYAAEAEEVNFADSVNTANNINHWVEQKTNDKIKDLISADSLDSLTRLVLVNAVYFKGNWKKQFEKALTREEPFYLVDGSEVKCQMMHLNGKFKYMEDDNLKAKVLELPYAGDQMSMLIFLPNERDGIKHLESAISGFDFANYDRNMGKWEVDVSLPRFKIESKIELTDILKKMGLEVIFSDKANFTKISQKQEPLKVSEVIQKAFIEVNEEGAEAAAATAAIFGFGAAPTFLVEPPKEFTVDHPFLFVIVIKEGQQNIPLFTGRISKAKL